MPPPPVPAAVLLPAKQPGLCCCRWPLLMTTKSFCVKYVPRVLAQNNGTRLPSLVTVNNVAEGIYSVGQREKAFQNAEVDYGTCCRGTRLATRPMAVTA
jgi:hypothetical protein